MQCESGVVVVGRGRDGDGAGDWDLRHLPEQREPRVTQSSVQGRVVVVMWPVSINRTAEKDSPLWSVFQFDKVKKGNCVLVYDLLEGDTLLHCNYIAQRSEVSTNRATIQLFTFPWGCCNFV